MRRMMQPMKKNKKPVRSGPATGSSPGYGTSVPSGGPTRRRPVPKSKK